MIWGNFVIGAAIVLGFHSLIQLFLRRRYHIEKKKMFTSNHVNATHQKFDWGVRIIFTIVTIATTYFTPISEYSINILLIPLLLYVLASTMVNAYFEKNHSDNPNQAILSISEAAYFSFVLLSIMQFGFLDFI